MSDFLVPFGSRAYAQAFLLLLAVRGMDFLSTRMATPNLVLEGNPVAQKLGWRWGILVNLAVCFGFAFWPLPAMVISTVSVLAAARNFQYAWVIRSMGEARYLEWYTERLRETSVAFYLFCLFGQAALTAGVGGAVILLTNWRRDRALLAIGLGIVAYAITVAFYTLLDTWRMHCLGLRRQRPPRPSGLTVRARSSRWQHVGSESRTTSKR